MANDTVKASTNGLSPYQQRLRYWLDDGSLLLLSHRNLYKIHKTLLFRLSPTLEKWANQSHDFSAVDELLPGISGCTHVAVPDAIGLLNDDLEALLEHIYHDV